VIVTARHREESLQDVPASVQAISRQTLELKNTVTLADITAQTPGLFDPIGNPAIPPQSSAASASALSPATVWTTWSASTSTGSIKAVGHGAAGSDRHRFL
jgi:outer membrane receptor protein involved in Fe transport